MRIEYEDYRGAADRLSGQYSGEWADIEEVLSSMRLHLKASDQANIKGSPIFDPVGTNAFVKEELANRGWSSNLPIPDEFSFLGTDVDFAKRGLLLECTLSEHDTLFF